MGLYRVIFMGVPVLMGVCQQASGGGGGGITFSINQIVITNVGNGLGGGAAVGTPDITLDAGNNFTVVANSLFIQDNIGQPTSYGLIVQYDATPFDGSQGLFTPDGKGLTPTSQYNFTYQGWGGDPEVQNEMLAIFDLDVFGLLVDSSGVQGQSNFTFFDTALPTVMPPGGGNVSLIFAAGVIPADYFALKFIQGSGTPTPPIAAESMSMVVSTDELPPPGEIFTLDVNINFIQTDSTSVSTTQAITFLSGATAISP